MGDYNLLKLDFGVDDGYGSVARIGLIVLQADQTFEVEVDRIATALSVEVGQDTVGFYHSRIPMEVEVTTDSLSGMEQRLADVAGLLPTEFEFASIGYACTSAATVIGTDRVTELVQSVHPATPCSNPLSAAVAGLGSLGASRIALVTPYTAEVTAPIAERLTEAGFTVAAAGSFQEPNDLVVTRISPQSIMEGATRVVQAARSDGEGCDAVFVSCTGLRTLGLIEPLEAELGIPVISSNQALLWHLVRMAGIDNPIDGFGALWHS